MKSCEIPREDMLSHPIHLNLGETESDFLHAKRAAEDLAKSYYSDPMLLSWFSRACGCYSPHETECCEEGRPSWVSYAESRGGNLTIDVNNEDYVFIFRGKQELS